MLPKTKPILVGIVYRPPDQSRFLERLTSAITNTNDFKNQEVYILGDFNINLINNKKNVPNGIKKYREFCSQHGLKQLITSPTRITMTTTSLVDHILTNSSERVSQSGVADVGLSDHQMTYCTRKITRLKQNTHRFVKTRSFKNYSKDSYLQELENAKFPEYSKFRDINCTYSDFIGKLTTIIDKVAPVREMRIKANSQEWFDEEIHEHIALRDKMLAKFKRSRKQCDDPNYKKARNHVQTMIKRKKKNFVLDKLNQNIGKPKELWRSLKSLGFPSKQKSSSSLCLEKDGNLSFDPKANTEIFKDFYLNLADNLVKKLPSLPNKFGIETVKTYYQRLNLGRKTFSVKATSTSVVQQLLEDINPSKSAGLDNLTGKFLRDGASVLAAPISDLCNLSISLSTFPDDSKIAKLKPIYKKESKTEPKNYRPISLLPLISKIMEKIIHNQTQLFLNDNNILYKYQSGFRKYYSTDTCLSYLNDKVQIGFEQGWMTGMILIDLQKAFDTIDHDILSEKMHCLGFSEPTIQWFRSYLTNRLFSVNLGNEFGID